MKAIVFLLIVLFMSSCSFTHKIVNKQKELAAQDRARKAPYKAVIPKNAKKDRQALRVTLILFGVWCSAL